MLANRPTAGHHPEVGAAWAPGPGVRAGVAPPPPAGGAAPPLPPAQAMGWKA